MSRGLRKHSARLTLVVASGCFLFSACDRAEPTAPAANTPSSTAFTEDDLREIRKLSPLPDRAEDATNQWAQDARARRLGHFLFFDEGLSGSGDVSCASCHMPEHGFSIPDPFGEGAGVTPRHPPSLLNIAFHHWYDWDGKADTLWSQAIRPLESPVEHAIARTDIVRYVHGDHDLRAAYEAIFGEMPDFSDTRRFPENARPMPRSPDSPPHQRWTQMREDDRRAVDRALTHVTKSIAAYQMQLVSGDSAFDDWASRLADGEPATNDAISPAAQRGLKLFVREANCVACHNGSNFSDGTFHNLGLPPGRPSAPPDRGRQSGVEIVRASEFNARGAFSDATEGRRARWLQFLTRTPEDIGQFKTPTLRNVARTPPYMHAGQFQTLEQVVAFYNSLPGVAQVGHREEMLEPLNLSQRDIADLVAFLKTLDGAPLDPALTRAPTSPTLSSDPLR